MSALLPADVSVILSLGPELNVEALTVDSTDVVVVNATMPMVLSYDPVKGDKGDAGAPSTIPGPPGPPLNILGTVPTAADLPATGNEVNDTFITEDTGHAWTWTGDPAAWTDLGAFTGPPGTRGSLWFTGAGPPPTPLNGALPGDYYLDSVSGNYYLLS
jgi:hypothetical protein